MAKVLHLFRAPKRHAPMEEALDGPRRRKLRPGRLRPRSSRRQTPSAACGCGNASQHESDAGNHARKHHHGRFRRKRVASRPDTPNWECASGSQRGLRTVRVDGDNSSRFATGATGAVRHALPCPARRHSAAWRHARSATITETTEYSNELLRDWFSLQRRRFRRPILVLHLLLDGLFGRHNPLESAALAHGSLKKARFARQ